MTPTPKGWPRIAPALYYRNAAAAIDWLCDAFGFDVRLKVDGEGGKVAHSELVYGGGLIMVGEAGLYPDKRLVEPTEVGGANTQSLMVYVDDIEAHHARAVAAGATIAAAIKTSDYGEEYWADRGYEAVDPGGHHWWFSQRTREATRYTPVLDEHDKASGPIGWPRISSALYYPDIHAAIDWLGRALGFEVQIKVEGEDGAVEHCELVCGGGLIMPSAEDRDRQRFPYWQSPRSVDGANTQYLMMFVDDTQAAFARAQAAGATVTDAPAVSDYGEDYWADLSCGIVDPGGHRWWLTQRVRG